jgi:hypothetical protein
MWSMGTIFETGRYYWNTRRINLKDYFQHDFFVNSIENFDFQAKINDFFLGHKCELIENKTQNKYFDKSIFSNIVKLPTLLQFRIIDNKIFLHSFYYYFSFINPQSVNIDNLDWLLLDQFMVKYKINCLDNEDEIYIIPNNSLDLINLNIEYDIKHRFYKALTYSYYNNQIQEYYIPEKLYFEKDTDYISETCYKIKTNEQILFYHFKQDSNFLKRNADIFNIYKKLKAALNVNPNTPVIYAQKKGFQSIYLFLDEKVILP